MGDEVLIIATAAAGGRCGAACELALTARSAAGRKDACGEIRAAAVRGGGGSGSGGGEGCVWRTASGALRLPERCRVAPLVAYLGARER
jgi:hypothetical protein